jgi:hypothetical protein
MRATDFNFVALATFFDVQRSAQAGVGARGTRGAK